MNDYPTVTQSLTLLEKNPQIAAEFLACHPGKSRREAVEATLEAIAAKRRENLALKEKLAATKTKLAALEKAKRFAPAKSAAVTRPAMKPPAPKNELQTYLRMPRGLAKSAYLRANAVKIQQQAKQ